MDPFNMFRRQVQSAFDDWDSTFGSFPTQMLLTDFSNDNTSATQQSIGTSKDNQQLATRGNSAGQLSTFNRPVTCHLDVIEEKDKYIVNAELPGLPKDQIKLNVHDNTLTISGERKHEVKEEDKDLKYLRMERSYGAVTRSIRLPRDIDPSKISAKHENGVLKVNIPRLPEQQQKQNRIQIE